MTPWEEVADAILRGLAAKVLKADLAVPWLKALVDYAELEGGNGAPALPTHSKEGANPRGAAQFTKGPVACL